jgi:hypothetical protein
MREIEFRGKVILIDYWGKRETRWENGSLIKKGRDFYIRNNKGFEHLAVPETVGEYTGLKDKNDLGRE